MIYQKSCAYPQQPFGADCGCPVPGVIPALPADAAAAMAYVPFQTDNAVYDVQKALQRGTVFPVLDKPFLAGGRR